MVVSPQEAAEWPDLRDRLDRAHETLSAAVADGRRLTTEEASAVSDAINAARAALGEGGETG